MGGWAQRAHSSHGWGQSSSQIVSQNKYLKTHTFSPCTPPSTHLRSFIWRSRRSLSESRVVQKLRARVPRFHVRCSLFAFWCCRATLQESANTKSVHRSWHGGQQTSGGLRQSCSSLHLVDCIAAKKRSSGAKIQQLWQEGNFSFAYVVSDLLEHRLQNWSPLKFCFFMHGWNLSYFSLAKLKSSRKQRFMVPSFLSCSQTKEAAAAL